MMSKFSKLKSILPNHVKYLRYGRMSRATKLVDYSKPAILDTSIDSKNAGDSIIMHYANEQLSTIWPGDDFVRASVHSLREQDSTILDNTAKILCGTNAIPVSVDRFMPIALPKDPSVYYKSVVLLAVGLSMPKHTKNFTTITARLLRSILADDCLHSVRDSHTEKLLQGIGITNVVNTSCVTMWNLTEKFCSKLPINKSKDVLTTITDYCFSPEDDKFMLETLKAHYRHVYLWLQGSQDFEKFKSLGIDGINLIFGGYQGMVDFCTDNEDYDYFGTRLHCGIYCLNHGIRSMVVSVDNRAEDIERDTNLPVVKRSNLRKKMESLIEEDRTTDIHIPEDNIKIWKSQFN